MLRPFWRRVQRHLRVQVRAYLSVVIPQLLPFSRAASYSCVQLEREVELDPGHQYIFGWHPHGILLLSHCAMCGGLWEKLFPGIEQRVRHLYIILKTACPPTLKPLSLIDLNIRAYESTFCDASSSDSRRLAAVLAPADA